MALKKTYRFGLFVMTLERHVNSLRFKMERWYNRFIFTNWAGRELSPMDEHLMLCYGAVPAADARPGSRRGKMNRFYEGHE